LCCTDRRVGLEILQEYREVALRQDHVRVHHYGVWASPMLQTGVCTSCVTDVLAERNNLDIPVFGL
jgi:hypothetical protein